MDSKAFTVDIRTFYGGRFLFQKGKTEYVADGLFSDNHKYGLHLQCGVWSHKLTLSFLRSLAESLVESKEFELWYKKHGKNLTAGKTMMVSDLDIVNLLKTKDAANFVTVYVIQPVLNMKIANPRILHVKPLNSIPPPTIPPPRIGSPTPRTKTPNVVGSPSQQKSILDGPSKSLMEKKPNLKAQKIVNAQHDESEFHPLPYSACFQSSWDPNPTLNAQQPKDSHVTSPLSLRRSPRFSSKVSKSNPTTSTAPIPKSSTKGPLLEKAVILSPITCITTPHFQTNSFRPKLATKKKLQFVEGDTSTGENVGKGSDTTNLEKVVAEKAAEKAAEKTSKRASKKVADKTSVRAPVRAAVRAADKRSVGVKEVLTTEKRAEKICEGRTTVKEVVRKSDRLARNRSVRGDKRVEKRADKRETLKKVDKRADKGKQICEGVSEDEGEIDSEGVEFTDSEGSDNVSDPDWEFNELDEEKYDEGDLFGLEEDTPNVEEVLKSLGLSIVSGEQSRGPDLFGVDDIEVEFDEEESENSDELRSLHGSDEEEDDQYSTFNPETDFNGILLLKPGLKFDTNVVLRKALVHHSVQNGYDFYYTHNNKQRLTARCKNRCPTCPWNYKRSTLGACNCEEGIKCDWMIHATRIDSGGTFQIKSMKPDHVCTHARYNRKVSSEYLAEKYIEFWRTNSDWKIKKFQENVLKDLNVDVTYTRCWLARTRAKLMIYGNGKDQYARLWDYVAAIKKYNEGSSAVVFCDSIERPPPIFKRIYICLKACKEGFLNGCRPIIGVDGCHLRGIYPGICLVAVAKDGNNAIYPVAWAVVEVENTQSWQWFLQLLANDLGKDEGKGLTFMSDRQKGLLDAFKLVVPKAELRFCARHIWANFKLHFSGQVYKDKFWKAATATTKAEFDASMDCIKSMSTEAWTYLANIPAKHWSRHAFDVNCKSELMLNNICESFNSVLKEARDKPILTHMEWMRRYVMGKNCKKREAAMKYKGKLMPYVNKIIKTGIDDSKLCRCATSTPLLYEVDYKGDRSIVNLTERSCTCFQWNLTGIPCVHAIGCMLELRINPEDHVDDYYSKAKYISAYAPPINPLPGAKHWEKTGLPEPLPPPMRKMPGRPSSKKRVKEPGEGSSHRVKRKRSTSKCKNCGQQGHYKKTCTNATVQNATEKQKGGRPPATSPWVNDVRERNAKRKADKEAYAFANLSSTSVLLESVSEDVL